MTARVMQNGSGGSFKILSMDILSDRNVLEPLPAITSILARSSIKTRISYGRLTLRLV